MHARGVSLNNNLLIIISYLGLNTAFSPMESQREMSLVIYMCVIEPPESREGKHFCGEGGDFWFCYHIM